MYIVANGRICPFLDLPILLKINPPPFALLNEKRAVSQEELLSFYEHEINTLGIHLLKVREGFTSILGYL